MYKKVDNYNTLDKDKFFKFNKKIFPERDGIENFFYWYYIKNPLIKDGKNINVLLFEDDSGDYIGQFLLNPFELSINGDAIKCYWGMDYYVDKEHRGVGGAILARNAITRHKPYFTIGPSEISKMISTSLGAKIIGKMKIFMWFKSPFSILKYKYLHGTKALKDAEDRFPVTLDIGSYKFNLIKHINGFCDSKWENTIQSSRSDEFLNWRFSNDYKDYHLYYLDQNNLSTYFVVRKCILRGMKFIALVDYRIPEGRSELWSYILKSTKKIAKNLKYDGIITMASHKAFNNELKKNLFIFYGGYKEILSNIDMNSISGALSNEEYIYFTMADCDVDLCLD